MNKINLIRKVSEKVKTSSNAAKVIVDTIFDGTKGSLEEGERIEIRGFGSFVMRQYGVYKSRNPKTEVIMDVPF